MAHANQYTSGHEGRGQGSNQGQHARSASGNTNPGNFANDREKAREAGRKGGQQSGGNFANDPQRAAEAGRKGGQNSHGGGRGGY
jgi:general stress protein YciG